MVSGLNENNTNAPAKLERKEKFTRLQSYRRSYRQPETGEVAFPREGQLSSAKSSALRNIYTNMIIKVNIMSRIYLGIYGYVYNYITI